MKKSEPDVKLEEASLMNEVAISDAANKAARNRQTVSIRDFLRSD